MWHFRSRFPNKILYEFLIPLICIACSTHLILFGLISLTILGTAPHYVIFFILLFFPFCSNSPLIILFFSTLRYRGKGCNVSILPQHYTASQLRRQLEPSIYI
jgi:hypothetical protein